MGSDFATQMGYDLATGLFPARLKAYYQAVRKARDPRHRRSFRAGTLSFSLNVLLLCVLAVGIYSGTRTLQTMALDFTPISANISHAIESWPWQRMRPPRPATGGGGAAATQQNEIYSLRGYDVLSRRDVMAAAALAVMLATVAALFLKPSALWAVPASTSAGIAVFGPLALSLWKGSDELPRAAVVFACLFGLPALFLLILLAASIHFGSVSLFLAATARVRRSGHPARSFFTAGWGPAAFAACFIGATFFFYISISLLWPSQSWFPCF